VDGQRLLRDPHSRRNFLRASGVGVGGGSAAFLAACGSAKKKAKGPSADVDILNSAIDLENMAIAAYTAGAPLLKGEILKLGRQFLAQEKEHADALSQTVMHAGGRPDRPKSSYDFPRVRTQEEVLRLVATIENVAIAAYIDALPKLSSGDLRATATSILTTEAEHLAVIVGALGQPQAPTAFVVGKR
jgi:rubrerythrin